MSVFQLGLSNVKRLVIALVITATLLLLSLTTTNAFSGEAIYPDFQAPDSPPAPSGHPGDDLRFEHLTSDQGLSNNRVLSVIRDSQGFMWFGTLDGLNRYDGYEFRVFRHDLEDEHSLSADFVMALYQDKDDFLWVGTSGGGLNRYDPATEQFNHYRHDPADPNTLSSDNVTALYQDREGILWIGTDGGGLNRYDPTTETFTRYRTIFSLETLSNPRFLWQTGISIIAAILVTELGFLQRWFETASLSGQQWVVCILFGTAVLWVMEILKFINRRQRR